MDVVDKYLTEAVGADFLSQFAKNVKQDPFQILDSIDFSVRKLEGVLKAAGVKSLLKNTKNMSRASSIIRDRLKGQGVWN
jgi:hypothetical protein